MSTDSPNRLSHDELDALLRVWHDVNAERAAAGRDELVRRLSLVRLSQPGVSNIAMSPPLSHSATSGSASRATWRRPSLRAAASFFLLMTLIALLIPATSNRAVAKPDAIMVPDGGRLEALDERGNVIGPCALKHTDVIADIAGPFSRVTLTQQYHNPYDRKIEAIYTFPLSHRSAVDRMVMTVKTPGEPDRIVEGEVKERQQARQMYQAARQAGYVASLLEQERPNIFTQSVANIEPNAQVSIEISYIEMLQQRDGEYSFDFPMVVAPRYIPGSPTASLALLPAELKQRRGVILRAPAQLTLGQAGDSSALGSLQAGKLESLLFAAQAIEYPGAGWGAGSAWWGEGENVKLPAVWYPFEATYCDGSRELGMLFIDGTGQINNRWFYFNPDPRQWQDMGAGYEPDTNQVPDASRITPMPVRPPKRAGHDVSLTVNIDTGDGGPGIIDITSDLHDIAGWNGGAARQAGDGPRKATIALKNQREIPNRDFVLRWRCESDSIQEAVLTHADPKWIDRVEVPMPVDGGPGVSPGRVNTNREFSDNATRTGETPVPPMMTLASGGGFFTIVIVPPARLDDAEILPRELIFVLDTSGSMSGQPIEKAKDVMSRAIEAMRPGDTFNMITFAGDTRILWSVPRPNTQANRDEAQRFLAGQSGGGGTEMMTAINAALTPTRADVHQADGALRPEQLANLPADGRAVSVRVERSRLVLRADSRRYVMHVRDDLSVLCEPAEPFTTLDLTDDVTHALLAGNWCTVDGQRVLRIDVRRCVLERPNDQHHDRMRIVMFLTDGQVGNDDAIIAAVREHAKTTRVFSFGIGDSPNRYLLDGIAQAGRGESEYVNLNDKPDESVQRFVTRIASPVLRDIEIILSEGLQIGDTVPALDAIPDLWDVKPLIIHGRFPIGDGAGAQPPSGQAQSGTITIKGKTARGAYERTIDITLPQRSNLNPMLPALWARGKIDEIIANDIDIKRNGGMVQNASAGTRNAIIALGERYHIASNFTSFIAVEKTRITVGGQSVLVPVPIELPEGMEWEGVFGGEGLLQRDTGRRAQLQQGHTPPLAVSRFGWKAQVAQMLTFEADAGLNEFGLTNRFLVEGAEAGANGDGFSDERWYLASDSAGDPSIGLVNVNTAPAAMLNPNLAHRFSTTGNFAHAPGLDLDAALSQGQQNLPQMIELAWQKSSPRGFATRGDVMFVEGQEQPFVTDTNTGNGGGGGGFGGGGGGQGVNFGVAVGSDAGVFGEAGEYRTAAREAARHSAQENIRASISAGRQLPEVLVAELNELRALTIDLEHQKVAMDQAVRETTTQVEVSEQARVALEEELARAKQEHAMVLAQLGEANAMGFNPEAPARTQLGIVPDVSLTATIVRVERSNNRVLAEIDAGQRDGVKKDWIMTIGEGGTFKGNLRIIEVDIYRATGEVSLEQGPKAVQVGQKVIAVAGVSASGKPAAAPQQVTKNELSEELLDIVQETINSDQWASFGGGLADAEFENGVFMFRTLEDSPEAQQTVSKARAFLAFLQSAVPGLQDAGAIDVPPEKPAAPDLSPDLRLVVYDVRDLVKAVQAVERNVSEDDAAARIAEIITEFIDPVHWQENGGESGRIRTLKGNLIIITTPANHQSIGELMAKMGGVIAGRDEKADERKAPELAAEPQAAQGEANAGEVGDPNQVVIEVYEVRELLWEGPNDVQHPLPHGGEAMTRPELVGQLVNILQENVDPDGWRELGGDVGAIREIASVLVISNTHANHRDINGLLEQLLALRREEVWQRNLRDTRVPIDFQNNSLEQIFAFFGQVTGLDIAVDWEALATIGVKPEDTVTVQMTDVPMGTALERVLQSVGKDGLHPIFTGKDATLLITSPEALPKDAQASAAAIEAVAKAEEAMRERMLAAMRHEARLRRVIDQRLWAAVVAAKQEHAVESDPSSALTPALSQGERESSVVILVRAVDDATLDSLRANGLRIDDRNARMKLVAGAIDAAKLADLASLDFVRRIEPIVIAP